jgi:hypothetical protein
MVALRAAGHSNFCLKRGVGAETRQKVAAPVLGALCGMAPSEKKPLYCLDFWLLLIKKK